MIGKECTCIDHPDPVGIDPDCPIHGDKPFNGGFSAPVKTLFPLGLVSDYLQQLITGIKVYEPIYIINAKGEKVACLISPELYKKIGGK